MLWAIAFEIEYGTDVHVACDSTYPTCHMLIGRLAAGRGWGGMVHIYTHVCLHLVVFSSI